MNKLLERIRESFGRGRRFVKHDAWRIGLPGEDLPHGFIAKQVRVAFLLLRGLGEETVLLRASALTFATMLFIVPFLTFMFFIIQTFNLGDEVYRSLSEKLDTKITHVASALRGMPEEEVVAETPETKPDHETETDALRQQLIELVFPRAIFSEDGGLADGTNRQDPVQELVNLATRGAKSPKTIGISGLLFILSTVFGFMRNVEVAFNKIWGVRRTRSPFRAISDYMMVTLVLPFAAAGVLAITAAMQSDTVANALGPLAVGLRGGQFGVLWFIFTILYFFVPNTRVRLRYAVLGGFVGALLLTLSSSAFVKFQFGLSRYDLFFSSFALFPLLVMWIFVSWLILLFGALVTFAYQNEKTFAMERWAEGASYAYREALGLRAVVDMARRFKEGQDPLGVEEAAAAWNVPTRLLHETMTCLVNAKLAMPCATEPVTYQPGRSPDATRIRDVVRAIRESGQDPSLLRAEGAFRPLYEGVQQGDAACLDATIADMLERTFAAATVETDE